MRLYLSSYRLGSEPEVLKELAGGRARVAVICNATDFHTDAEQAQRFRWEADALGSLRFTCEPLDLRNFFEKPEGLGSVLSRIDLVWVRGGNTFILRRAMVRSGFDQAARPLVLDGTLAYGGFSAGAIAATPTLRGTELMDEPDRVPAGYELEPVWHGLNYVPYSIVPHYRSPHPESPLAETVVQAMSETGLDFRTLRDGEAIVVDDSGDRIVGEPDTASN